MTLAELSDLAQTIAAIAVVVSIVYLAIQTRQAAQNAKAAIHEDRAATILGHIENMIDSDFHPVWNKGNRIAADMSDEEAERYMLFVAGVVLVWEERFRQKQEGMMTGDRWASSERTIRTFTTAPGFRAMIAVMRPGFDPEFGALMDKHLAQGRAAPDGNRAAVWRAAATRELAAPTAGP
jgi:hypothetical protein